MTLTSAMAQPNMDNLPPAVAVETPADAPVKEINPVELQRLGAKLGQLFTQYRSDRRLAELRWLRNERQYLGIYDPDVDKELQKGRSRSYPKVTRTKCISVLSRLMSLMFPGNERNWEIKARPSPDMDLKDVTEAIKAKQKRDTDSGADPAPVDIDYVRTAIQALADQRAEELSTLIDDQLEELGGHQAFDYIRLNREAVRSGVIFGLGVLEGPFARKCSSTIWTSDPDGSNPKPSTKTIYKPQFEFLRVWDFYPDMAAKNFDGMDGHFIRKVMSKAQVRALADREDFFTKVIKQFLTDTPQGNYRPLEFETELRSMGVKSNTNEQKVETSKYEIIIWHGMTDGAMLRLAGIDVPEDKVSDNIDAEIWMIGDNVIKAILNPWKSLGVDVKTIHTFLFDTDDTSPVGLGLPVVMRDSQMAISAASRMLLDNASVVCGPNLELNTDLLRPDQDLMSTSAYKIWYREGIGQDSQYDAVRNIEIKSYIPELQGIVEFYMKIADSETFVGPATGGDMSQSNSEPMRTAAGASMIRGDAALPFKDIVRSFDTFTQSILDSMVQFNRQFNPDLAPEADYDVIARGATSLVAKEVRGLQIDQFAATLKPAEEREVDMRKLVKQRLLVRDMGDLLVSSEESDRRKKSDEANAASQADMVARTTEATLRKLLSEAYKNIASATKNNAEATAVTIEAAQEVLERGLNNVLNPGAASAASGQTDPSQTSTGAGEAPQPAAGGPPDGSGGGIPGNSAGPGQ